MTTVRVLTYNVRYFGHATRGLASTARSMARIAAAFAALEPLADVIGLQEVETRSLRSNLALRTPREETQLERFMASLRNALHAAGKREVYEAYYFPAHTYGARTAPLYTTGLAVLARRPFRVLHHNAASPHDITHRALHPVKKLKQTRICAHVRMADESGVEFDVFNTHLSLPTTLSRDFWLEPKRLGWGPNQREEARNVASFVARERKSERYVLFGDFNALPSSPVVRQLREAGFRDALATHVGLDERSLEAWPTAGFMNLRMHLDYVFSGAGVTWLNFDGSHHFDDRNSIFYGLSDHVPTVGSFTFNPDLGNK